MESSKSKPAALTPAGLRLASDYSWRLLVVAAAVVAVVYLLIQLRPLIVATVLALFLTALLAPLAKLFRERLGAGPGLSAGLALGLFIAFFCGVWALLVPAFVSQLGDLGTALEQGIDDAASWAVDGPLGLSQQELDDYVDRGVEQLGNNSGGIASGVFAGALLAAELLGAVLLALVATFFLIRDGREIWAWIASLFSRRIRPELWELAERSWGVVGGYLRGVSIVALFDAVVIGVALVALGVPAALPLAVITFFGAFVPFAGAVVAGLLAALVALVANGVTTAVIVIVIVIIVQQIEGDLLYPLVVGRSIELHPLAILVVITAGAVLGGVFGAIVAIPIAAVVSQAVAFSRERRGGGSPAPHEGAAGES